MPRFCTHGVCPKVRRKPHRFAGPLHDGRIGSVSARPVIPEDSAGTVIPEDSAGTVIPEENSTQYQLIADQPVLATVRGTFIVIPFNPPSRILLSDGSLDHQPVSGARIPGQQHATGSRRPTYAHEQPVSIVVFRLHRSSDHGHTTQSGQPSDYSPGVSQVHRDSEYGLHTSPVGSGTKMPPGQAIP